MKLGGEVFPAFKPYDKPTYEIHISGCKNNCKGCHNKVLQDFDYGEDLDVVKYFTKLKERTKFYEAICIMGGDLLDQDIIEMMDFCKLLQVSFSDKELWLFTGKQIQEIPEELLEIFDYIKVGEYKEELQQEGFPSSKNQKLLKKGVDYGRD